MVKFFAIVRPWPLTGLVVLTVAVVLAIATMWLNPREIDSGLGMVLFVQMFLASSGFLVPARRGHFDPMLVHGRDRGAAVAAQWVSSIAPGAIAWIAVAGSGYLMGAAAGWSALAGVRLIAFVVISTVAWTAGFVLPRGGGAALWMAILLVLLLKHVPLLGPGPTQTTTMEVLRTIGALLICPFLLLGPEPRVGAPALAGSVCAALAILLIAWRLGRGIDVFLAEHS